MRSLLPVTGLSFPIFIGRCLPAPVRADVFWFGHAEGGIQKMRNLPVPRPYRNGRTFRWANFLNEAKTVPNIVGDSGNVPTKSRDRLGRQRILF